MTETTALAGEAPPEVDSTPRCIRCHRKLKRPRAVELLLGWRCAAHLEVEDLEFLHDHQGAA